MKKSKIQWTDIMEGGNSIDNDMSDIMTTTPVQQQVQQQKKWCGFPANQPQTGPRGADMSHQEAESVSFPTSLPQTASEPVTSVTPQQMLDMRDRIQTAVPVPQPIYMLPSYMFPPQGMFQPPQGVTYPSQGMFQLPKEYPSQGMFQLPQGMFPPQGMLPEPIQTHRPRYNVQISSSNANTETHETRRRKSIKQNRKRSANPKRCYTCNPKGEVQRHIISDTRCNRFHFDMWDRKGMIIATPKQHFKDILEMDSEIIKELFQDIDDFCRSWNLRGYQLTFGSGNWKTHDHFHIKIKTDENIIQRMHHDHFERVRYERELRLPHKQGIAS